MNELITILGVGGLFLIRIGIPIILLICLGLVLDRWQSKGRNKIERHVH